MFNIFWRTLYVILLVVGLMLMVTDVDETDLTKAGEFIVVVALFMMAADLIGIFFF